MWRSYFVCRTEFPHHYEISIDSKRSPYMATEKPPRCKVCHKRMHLAKVDDLRPKEKHATVRFQPKQKFGAEQMEMFGGLSSFDR
jgi:hypothetical protein